MSDESSSPKITVPVTLSSGVVQDFTVEDLVDLWKHLPNLYEEAVAATKENHVRSMDPEKYGLIQATDWGEYVFCLPGGYGKSPGGVPVLFYSINPNLKLSSPESATLGVVVRQKFQPKKPRIVENSSDPEQGSCWTLVISGFPTIPLTRVGWNDREGFEKLIHSMKTLSSEALLTQVFLVKDALEESGAIAKGTYTMDESGRETRDQSSEFARRMLNVASGIPNVRQRDFTLLGGQNVAVDELLVIDPDLCRYIQIPGAVIVTPPEKMGLGELDKLLSSQGLIPLRPKEDDKWWVDRHRIAVAKGYGARFKEALREGWPTLMAGKKLNSPVSSGVGAPTISYLVSDWYKGFANKAEVVVSEALSLEERNAVLAFQKESKKQ